MAIEDLVLLRVLSLGSRPPREYQIESLLHQWRRFAGLVRPLFLNGDQEFVRSDDLKADVARLDEYFSRLPDEIKERGVISFASNPPVEGNFLTARLWDRFCPGWREHAHSPEMTQPRRDEKLLVQLDRMDAAQPEPVGLNDTYDQSDPDFLTIKRMVPSRIGKWQTVPVEAEREPAGREKPERR